jgi:hypothetical protein
MNRWKIAFWICFTTLIIILGISIYSILDQSVTLTYIEEGYQDTDNDLTDLIEIINKTDLSKKEIMDVLRQHKIHEHGEYLADTISLNKIQLIFKDAKLKQIRNQW